MTNNFNELNQVPLANLSPEELQAIRQTEERLDSKYYLIAFKRD